MMASAAVSARHAGMARDGLLPPGFFGAVHQ
jgi:hypothetical protein